MNIFVLDKDPRVAARYHCDKHVIKMITESCQILSTARRLNRVDVPPYYYKNTHIHHPCVKWVAKSEYNLIWLAKLAFWLIWEYEYRYKPQTPKFEQAKKIVNHILYNIDLYSIKGTLDIPTRDLLSSMDPFALAMPDKYKSTNAVLAYRLYYIQDKQHLFKWTGRNVPKWVTDPKRELSR